MLFVTPSLFVPDGVSLTLCKLARFLVKQGAKVTMLTTKPLGPAPDLPTDLPTIFAPGLAVPIAGQQAGYQLGALLNDESIREVRRFRPNVVHLSVPDWNGMGAAKLAREMNVPTLCTYHSNYGDYLRFYHLGMFRSIFNVYLTHFYAQTPALFVPTPFIRDKLRQDGIDGVTDLRIWGRGVDFDLFDPDLRATMRDFRGRFGLRPTEVVIVWVGRLVREKRPDIFLNVLERLNAEGVPCRGLVVGVGPYEDLMSASPHCIHAGFLSGRQLASAYACSDLLLFPSDVETFGNVTLEALAAGCPVVVEEGCSGHLVQDGINGEAVKAGDEEGFYKATKRLAGDAEYRRRLSAACRASVAHYEKGEVERQMAMHYLEAARIHAEGHSASVPHCMATETARKHDARMRSLWRLVFLFVYPVLSVITAVLNLLSLCECSPCRQAKEDKEDKSCTQDQREEACVDDAQDVELGIFRAKQGALSADLLLSKKAKSATFGIVSIFHLRHRWRLLLILMLYGSLLGAMLYLTFNG